jgi:hypothetical protein
MKTMVVVAQWQSGCVNLSRFRPMKDAGSIPANNRLFMGNFMGNYCLNNHAVRAYSVVTCCFNSEKLARPTRFERVTAWFVARFAIQQSRGLQAYFYRAKPPKHPFLSMTCASLCGALKRFRSLRFLNSAPTRTVQHCPIRTIYKSMTYGVLPILAGLHSTLLGTKPHV